MDDRFPKLVMYDDLISLLPGVGAQNLFAVCFRVQSIPAVISADVSPFLQVSERMQKLLMRQACLLFQKSFDIFLSHLVDRHRDLFHRHALQQEFSFFLSDPLLLETGAGIKDLVQVDLLRLFIGGEQEAVAAFLIEVSLQLCQLSAVHLRDRTPDSRRQSTV